MKLGTKMKDPNLGLSDQGLNEQCANLEKYFYSYFIEYGKHKNGQDYSNVENFSGKKEEDIFFEEESSKFMNKKWLPLDF